MEQSIEYILRDLPHLGTCIKDRGYRQVWRFSVDGRGYYLKFFPRRFWLRRLLSRSPALRELRRLEWLADAGLAAPRPTGVLTDFLLNGQKGEVLITEAIEPSQTLEQLLSDAALHGEHPQAYRTWLMGTIDLLEQMLAVGLSHDDLHLGNFLVQDDRVYLIDAWALRHGRFTAKQLMLLEHSAHGWLSRTDRYRAWQAVGPSARPPAFNSISQHQWRKWLRRPRKENRYFGRIVTAQGSGFFMRRYPRPLRQSIISRRVIHSQDAAQLWEQLWRARGAADREAQRVHQTITLGETQYDLVLEYDPRARRNWHNGWRLIVRGLDTSWPVMVLGDRWMVKEACPWPKLSEVHLDDWPDEHRRQFFWRLGRYIREMDDTLLYHPQLSSASFCVKSDQKLSLLPILTDVVPIRARRGNQWSLPPLLTSMKANEAYTPQDSLWICRGYAPGTAVHQEQS